MEYISTIIVPTQKFNSLFDSLTKHRETIKYHGEMKFSDIGKSGERLELAKLWLNEILDFFRKPFSLSFFSSRVKLKET